MDTQLDFFSARKTDPHTSHAAAQSIVIRAGSQRAQLLQAYRDAGASGLTDDEAGVITGLAYKIGCCWWKRCSELRQAGYIQPTSQTRASRAGEAQQVCVITDEGKKKLPIENGREV